ncbi:MAG: enoyl-ACP reductase [Firmicutes bacterium]|nr:enoyl-ACP reductase [Bacillota bacterium]
MLLKGKKAVIFNIANKRSIAWAIAQSFSANGADLILGYQNERSLAKVEELVDDLPNKPLALVQCDVSSDEEVAQAAQKVQEVAGEIDILVHCLAFAPREALQKPFSETRREEFNVALDISTYSLITLSNAFKPLIRPKGSIIALSYYGSEKVVPNYNVMGVAKAALEASARYLAFDLGSQDIRVNVISAGPINTLAARGISGFVEMLDVHASRSPFKRNIEPSEVGKTATFLASDLSTGITGEIIYVDAGYNIMGM